MGLGRARPLRGSVDDGLTRKRPCRGALARVRLRLAWPLVRELLGVCWWHGLQH